MATYKHGVYTSEQATSMTAPVTGTAGLQVVVGTAPVNMLEHPERAVNTPLLVYNYKEAVAAVGYHDDFAAYTLCESISAAFSVVGTGPLVLINVLDPAKHTADIAETTVQVNSGVAVLGVVGALLDKLTVKSGSTALTRDTDYTASFNNDGTLNIVPLAGGKAASATTLTVSGKKLDPSKVKAADIVGGVDAATGKETGLEVVRQIYPKLSMTPGILLAPRFSMDATVAAALQAKTKEINALNIRSAELAGLTLGVQNLIYNAVFFTMQMIWGRRYVGFGTVANAVCCGFIITFFYDFLTAHFAQAATLPAQLAWVAAAVVCTSLGISLHQTSDLGVAPYDYLALGLRDHTPLPYFCCRLFTDTLCALDRKSVV